MKKRPKRKGRFTKNMDRLDVAWIFHQAQGLRGLKSSFLQLQLQETR